MLVIPSPAVVAASRPLQEDGIFFVVSLDFFIRDKTFQSHLPMYLLTSCFLGWGHGPSGDTALLAVDEMFPVVTAGGRWNPPSHLCPARSTALAPGAAHTGCCDCPAWMSLSCVLLEVGRGTGGDDEGKHAWWEGAWRNEVKLQARKALKGWSLHPAFSALGLGLFYHCTLIKLCLLCTNLGWGWAAGEWTGAGHEPGALQQVC